MELKSVCGLFECEACGYQEDGRCPGCRKGNEMVASVGGRPCAVYNCAVKTGVSSCAECGKPNCDVPRLIDYACPMRAQFQNKRWWASRLADFLVRRGRERRESETAPKISARTVGRLRWYLLLLQELEDKGVECISSREIATRVGVNAALVRKDLSHFGDFGTPSYGYSVKRLVEGIRKILNLDEPCYVAWVGAQRLAENQDLLLEMGSHNCHVVTVLDTDESHVGARIAGIRVEHLSEITKVAESMGVNAAVIAVPNSRAQEVADLLTTAGVKSILNLTTTVLSTPSGVVVRNANVVSEMMALSFYSAHKGEDTEE